MTDKRGPKGAPIRVGEDFSEDEATLLDVSADAVRAALRARELAEQQGSVAGAEKRAPPPSVADVDIEKTEMLERPDLDGSTPPALVRGVVPLGADAARLLGKTGPGEHNRPRSESSSDLLSDEAETVLLSRPKWSSDDDSALRAAQPEVPEAQPVRALGELTHTAIIDDPSDDKTLSRPKIARMTFRKGERSLIDEEPDGAEDDTRRRTPNEREALAKAPAPRPLPAPPASSRIRRPAATRSGPAAEDDVE